MKKLWILITRLCGWKFVPPQPDVEQALHRCVIIMAPHTAIDDFFLGGAYLWKLKVNCRIFVKKEFFNRFTRPILTHFGVVAVDRGNPRNGLVEQCVTMFGKESDFTLVVTPEGTRKAVKRWKRGFYEIASKAGVPIVMSYIDYSKKQMGFKGVMTPTGNFEADVAAMMHLYEDVTAKHVEWYNKYPEKPKNT